METGGRAAILLHSLPPHFSGQGFSLNLSSLNSRGPPATRARAMKCVPGPGFYMGSSIPNSDPLGFMTRT